VFFFLELNSSNLKLIFNSQTLLPEGKTPQINGSNRKTSLKINVEEENLNNNNVEKAGKEKEVFGGEEENETADTKLHYGLEDIPPWYTCIVLGFQV